MPMTDGLVRRYDALDLTDGFIGGTEYTYVQDSNGEIVIFKDATGIRRLPPPITRYSAVQSEMIEDKLCSEGNWQEGQMMYGVNNFHLMLHTVARPSHNIWTAKRSIEVQGFNMRLMELFGDDGNVPPAWYSAYAWCALIRAAAYFGNGEPENGYNHLEIMIEYYEMANSFKEGDLLDVGNAEVFGGVKYQFNSEKIQLPNGRFETIEYGWRMSNSPDLCYGTLIKWISTK